MNLNLNKPIAELDDGVFPEATLGQILANLLRQSTSGDALKFLDWAIDLYATGSIQIDTADFELLFRFVKNARECPLARGEILREMIYQHDVQKTK